VRAADEQEAACATLLARARCTPDDGVAPADAERELAARCARHAAYRQAADDLLRARQDARTARDELAAQPGFDVALHDVALHDVALHDVALHDASADRLDGERARAAAEAEGADALVARISALDTRVAAAQAGCDVEAALAGVAAAESALADARDRDLRAMVGGVLARYVLEAARDHHRPDVFRRADALFTRVTAGAWRLALDDGAADGGRGDAAFRAVHVPTGSGHALAELSSATRVQLLLAVRVAFVESQEQGVRLPLVLDEVLGRATTGAPGRSSTRWSRWPPRGGRSSTSLPSATRWRSGRRRWRRTTCRTA
jgi:uncharacterized protein YhaN